MAKQNRLNASYRRGIEFIALNDGDACEQARSEDGGQGMVSIMTLAAVFDIDIERVVDDLLRYLRREGS